MLLLSEYLTLIPIVEKNENVSKTLRYIQTYTKLSESTDSQRHKVLELIGILSEFFEPFGFSHGFFGTIRSFFAFNWNATFNVFYGKHSACQN